MKIKMHNKNELELQQYYRTRISYEEMLIFLEEIFGVIIYKIR